MDDRFDDLLRDAAREYNEPPETPRDAMWERIVAERGERAERADAEEAKVLPFRPVRWVRPFRVAAGIAAVLALGIGLGRLSAPVPSRAPSAPVAVQPAAPRANTVAYEVATTEYLGQSEAFLTLFRASLHQRSDMFANGGSHLESVP